MSIIKENEDSNPINSNENVNNLAIGFFSFEGRSSRSETLKLLIPLLLCAVEIVYFVLLKAAAYMTIYFVGILIIYLLASLALIPIQVRRLHDSDLSENYILLIFAPIILNLSKNLIPVNLFFILEIICFFMGLVYYYFMFRAGNPEHNQYGVPNAPTKYSHKTINILSITLVMLMIIIIILPTILK